MRRKPNILLVIGIVLLSFFVIISLIGPYIAPYDLEYSKKIEYITTDDGKQQLKGSPFPPSKEHVFGTDKWGYDILTLLLYGAKYTVFTVLIVAVMRLSIGTAFGVLNGVMSPDNKKKNKHISLFSGIPIFIIIYFILAGINIEPTLPPIYLAVIQGLLMTILGIPGVYNVIFNLTIEIKKNAYVEAAKTLGGSNRHISRKHIFPALKGNLLALFVNECIQVLHIIGQLGIFNLFLGGTEKQYFPTIYLSITNEWSGLIGQSRSFLYHSQWIILYPLMAYMLLLFSFYLLSAGLNASLKNKARRSSHL
ncbi:ABC transporter permease [Cytobacillus praedii]|uniref:ABC transporter permease subunit n=1 Tax=Cytobacillus praedii TaxID=1742358 RepID=A0A4V2NUF7_9BACI|nr:ABC transporter permease subunit [Cytobacillus praedii]MED3549077.1 ABC transporter permease subunit [Cytobacillus praedii]TCJ04258.1 ABC transporter permease subunit [Cytobacillus praedii]